MPRSTVRRESAFPVMYIVLATSLGAKSFDSFALSKLPQLAVTYFMTFQCRMEAVPDLKFHKYPFFQDG
jgi:hypothetical protein